MVFGKERRAAGKPAAGQNEKQKARKASMPNIAVLIDAENVLPIHADQIFTHASSLGNITVKEIYGAAAALTAWVEPVLKYALHANLTIKASKGKNTSDIALVIGAMDLLVAGNIDTVVIVSSDSDFSALSVRLRSAGIEVVGMGTEKANPLWRTACSAFVVLQAPSFRPAPAQQSARSQPAAKPAPQKQEAPANPNANQPKKKADSKPVAPTHAARMAIITAFIREQLEANGGKMAVSALLPALNGLAEYRVDQQRSKRNAHNYLMRLYGDAFTFEEGEGGSFISLRASAPEQPKKPEETPAAEADELPEIETAEPEPAEEPAQAPAEEPAPAEPEAQADEQGQVIAAFAARLVDAGIPADAAQQIIGILNENSNLRTVYNKMRVAFGGDTGRKYYQIVKEVGKG